MASLNRRTFVGSTLAGMAAVSWPGTIPLAISAPAPLVTLPPTVQTLPAGFDTVFLTWREDPTTTMTVQWIAPAAADSDDLSLYISTRGDQVWHVAPTRIKPFPDTHLKVYRCELNGLTPGTEYSFQIGNVHKTFHFRTMPAKANDIITFVSGGDAGVNDHAVNTNILAAKQEPSFALIGGDLAYDNGSSPQTFLAFLRNYSKHMVDPKGRLIPLLSCPGNHEVRGGYHGKRSDAGSYLSVFDGLFDDTTYDVLDFGDYLSLVLLDTDHISSIAGEQTDWLEKTLSHRMDCPHLIVANHVPAYPSVRSEEAGKGNRKHWVPLFEKFNVDVVLEHHDHTFKRTHPLRDGLKDKYGIVYLGDGSWGQLRAPKRPEELSYLARTSSAYHMTVHRLEGEQRFHAAIEESGKIADLAMTPGKRPARHGSWTQR